MQNAIYSGAASLDLQMRMQEMIAFNVANINTPGFKRRTIAVQNSSDSFQSTLDKVNPRMRLPKNTIGIDFSQGDVRPTGNPFDVALDGEGFMKVRTERGTRYTRNGSLTVNNAGELVTQSGAPIVLKEAGGPISGAGGEITIDKDGSIVQDGARLGKLDLVNFKKEELNKLIPDDSGLYRAPETAIEESSSAVVIQSSLESANVNPIEEFVGMISAGRNFEMAQRLIRSVDDSVRKNFER